MPDPWSNAAGVDVRAARHPGPGRSALRRIGVLIRNVEEAGGAPARPDPDLPSGADPAP